MQADLFDSPNPNTTSTRHGLSSRNSMFSTATNSLDKAMIGFTIARRWLIMIYLNRLSAEIDRLKEGKLMVNIIFSEISRAYGIQG